MKHQLILAAVAIGLSSIFSTKAATIDDELSGVSLDKITTIIGEGEKIAPVVIRFNYPYAVDNIVVGYRYNGNIPDAPAIMQQIATADSRFTFTAVDQTHYTIGMDLNGNHTIDEQDNLFTSGTEGSWIFTKGTIAGVDGYLISFDRDNDNEKSPIFYLPEANVKGIWLPEAINVKLHDGTLTVVAYVQLQSDGIKTQTWRRSSSNTEYSNDATILSSASSTNTRLYSMAGQYKGATGVTYLQFRPQFTDSKYYESNWCKLTVAAPEKPITSLYWANKSLNGCLSHQIDNQLMYEPADATFTMISLKSSNTKVATATGNKPSTAIVKSTTTAGQATITATYVCDENVTAAFDLTTQLVKRVEGISFEGMKEDGKIHLNPKEMLGLIPIFTPADADIQTATIELVGGGSDRATMIASMYKVNYWDANNTRIQFYELSGHRVGECKLTVKSGDGFYETEIPVVVEEPDRTPLENGYVDGTFMLNEEWFGHTNGGMNYITPEGKLMYQVYERENPGMSFGATSQYATIWANKLIVCSKQAVDAGDPLPGGGRIVVADARTLKRLGSIDNIAWGEETGSADGRACVGVSPTKAYVGSTKGVYVLDLENIKIVGKIGSIENVSVDLYNGQMGDMVYAAGKVYAIKQSGGVYVIDTEKDAVEKFIPTTGIQGITITADGHVWYTTTVDGCSNFVEIDPTSTQEISRFILPADYGTVACSWGAWRNTQFVGCTSQNAIWFATGAQGIAGGGDGVYYRFDTETKEVKLVADIRGFEGSNSRVKQKNYGTLRFDDRSGELIVMTCDNSSSGHYRYNWYHFFDPETATLKRTLQPRPYYWFQCFAIFPDKYAPEITGLEDIEIRKDATLEYNLSDLVSDKDNIDANIDIKLEILSEVENNQSRSAINTPKVANLLIEGGKLKVNPIACGTVTARLTAVSNGVPTAKDFAVTVNDGTTSINTVDAADRAITCNGTRVEIIGYNGVTFSLVTPAGVVLDVFTVDSDRFVLYPGCAKGIYLLSSDIATAKLYIR